jgi:hypothetical protein
MSVLEKEQALLQRWRTLPDDKQQETLDFIESLLRKQATKRPLRSALGLCADLKVSISDDDIAQARKEMWGAFPREIAL